MSDNGVCHVRPHGRDSKDTILLPVKDKVTGASEFTKQCFWFNNSYLKEIVAEFLWNEVIHEYWKKRILDLDYLVGLDI